MRTRNIKIESRFFNPQMAIVFSLVLFLLASCNRVNPPQQTVENINTTEAHSNADISHIIYPDPWQLTYKNNGVERAVSIQYAPTADGNDVPQIKDSMIYDTNGKMVYNMNTYFKRRIAYNPNGFMNIMWISNVNGNVRYLFNYENMPDRQFILQRAYELKDTLWDGRSTLKDTLRGFAPVFLLYDQNNHLIKEKSAETNITYTYDKNGYVNSVKDSSLRILQNRKAPLFTQMELQDNGNMKTYRDFNGDKISNIAILKKNGLVDTMKMFDPEGRIVAYRVVKYYFRK